MPTFDLKRFMKRAGQPYVVVRNDARLHTLEGLINSDKGSGRRYIGFFPGADLQPGDWVEGEVSGDRYFISEIASDVLDGRVFLVKGYALTVAEFAARAQPLPKGLPAVSTTSSQSIDQRKVFVVFGRNHAARDEMYSFLSALGLRPVEFDDAVRATGEGAPTIDRILDEAFAIAQAIVILLTGDDEARLREQFRKQDDPAHEIELTPQPRPNVLFEAGMAFGRHPTRSILVEMGRVRPFSDIAARYGIRFSGEVRERVQLKDRLKTAGCLVDDSGSHWYTAGDFAKALTAGARTSV